jgi:hypothetical protein
VASAKSAYSRRLVLFLWAVPSSSLPALPDHRMSKHIRMLA